MSLEKYVNTEGIDSKEKAEEFVALLDRQEEALLLTALLNSLPPEFAVPAANLAGYDLEAQ